MEYKQKLLKEVWESPTYAKSSENEWKKTFSENPALLKLKEYSKSGDKILDCGCGDGRILSKLWRSDANFWGIDLSKRAISEAKKRFKLRCSVSFAVGDLEKLPYKESVFDLVYSTYLLEHTEAPEKIISEMIRVTTPGGQLIFVCPNFGSPFQPSGNKLVNEDDLKTRALKIFIKSHLYIFTKPKNLDWNKVIPRALEEGKWKSDWDATCEPYIQTLSVFLRRNGLKIVESDSGLPHVFDLPQDTPILQKFFSLARRFFETVGHLGISPYKYFGPTIFMVARKL